MILLCLKNFLHLFKVKTLKKFNLVYLIILNSMNTIKTFDYKCTFTLIPLIKQNSEKNLFTYLTTNSFHLYDIPSFTINCDVERHIRLLVWLGIEDICIHTPYYENIEGWAYSLHLLFSGQYALTYNKK